MTPSTHPLPQPPAEPAVGEPAGMPTEQVEAELCTLAGRIAAATARFLSLLAEFDARRGWADWGLASCAQWLSWRCGLDLRTAREQVRVARRLADLPRCAAAFAAGRLSYSKVRALARVATPGTEEDLVDAALCTTAAQTERLCRGLHTAQARDDSDPDGDPAAQDRAASTGEHGRLGVRWRWDDDGTLQIWGRLPADEGARLLAAVTRLEAETTAQPGPACSGEHSAAGANESRGPLPVHEQDRGSAEPLVPQDGSPARLTAPRPDGDGDDNDVRDGSAEPSRPAAQPTARKHSGRVEPVGVCAAPSDLRVGLVRLAELGCTTHEPPARAPGADLVVHVTAQRLIQAISGEASAPGQGQLVPAARRSDGTTTEPAVLGRREQAAVRSSNTHGPVALNCTPADTGNGRRVGGPNGAAAPARLDDGPALVDPLLRRLACDARIHLSIDGPDGATLDLGRRIRYATNRQFHALWRRDRGCAYPGCTHRRFLHAHHVRPWALGGPTSVDNLLLLCSTHHAAVHEGAFAITALGRQRFSFHGPGGALRPVAPPLGRRVLNNPGSTSAAKGPAGGRSAATVQAEDPVRLDRLDNLAELTGLAEDFPAITAGTIEPDWDGSRLHLTHAVSCYLEAWASRTKNKTEIAG